MFPPLTREYTLAFQFSSWFPKFSKLSIKSTIIKLDARFREYLDADGVFPPDEYAFPEVDAQIRACIEEYGAVFPKLNFSSPRDAAWLLPASSPLKCTAPEDVYLLLKSSDYIAHDVSNASDLELVLRKWHPIDPSRELRCFVREGKLVGLSQRDPNYYEFWNEQGTRDLIVASVLRFWQSDICDKWDASTSYVFDILLTRDLRRAHIIDFNPYAPHTDPLLFTYEELHALLQQSPVLKVIDSRAHPAAARNAPVHQHNMLPLEAFTLSAGRPITELAEALQNEIQRSMQEED